MTREIKNEINEKEAAASNLSPQKMENDCRISQRLGGTDVLPEIFVIHPNLHMEVVGAGTEEQSLPF